MDVALSVAGLIFAGARVCKALNTFFSDASNAPAIAQAIEDEIYDFTQILFRVQNITFGSDLDLSKASLIDLNHLSSTLTASVRTFSELEREIDRVKGSGKMNLWDRFRWARAEKNLLFLIQRLQSHKSTFSVVLTILTSKDSTVTRESLTRLAEQFESMSKSLGNNTLVSDDSHSVHSQSQTRSTSNISMRSSQSLYRRSFESALYLARPYMRIRYSESIYSKDSKKSHMGRWSLYTANTNDSIFNLPISLCEPSGKTLADKDIGATLLPISADTLYNITGYESSRIMRIEGALVELEDLKSSRSMKSTPQAPDPWFPPEPEIYVRVEALRMLYAESATMTEGVYPTVYTESIATYIYR